MACSDTFDRLLEQLAARHRTEVQEAVNSLSVETHELRKYVSELEARLGDHSAALAPALRQVNGERDRQFSQVSVKSHEASQASSKNYEANPQVGMSAVHNDAERTNSIASRGIKAKKMDQIKKYESTKMLRRLQRILCEEGSPGDVRSQPLHPEKVLDALQRRGAHNYTLDSITELLQELGEVSEGFTRSKRSDSTSKCISLGDLVGIFMMHNPEQTIGEQLTAQLATLKGILVAEDLVEIMESLSPQANVQRRSKGDSKLVERLRQVNMLHKQAGKEMPKRLYHILNTVVGLCVVASILLIGVSLDNDPEHPVWLWAEAFFAAVFVFEVAVKLYYSGWHHYLVGADYAFNWLDLIVTIFATGDLLLSTLFHTDELKAFNGTMLLKSLRLFRFARLMKLFQSSPMLKQLASMLSGFLIGAPSLMWILVIILMFIYIMAIGFRSFFQVKTAYHGLTPSELIERCGHGDQVKLDMYGMPVDTDCVLHMIYAHEFFGTVPRSMVTVFRFMIGDTSTTAGKSLVQALDTTHQSGLGEQVNLGVPFYFFYIPFMTIVIFGIFNIITAIFVETTISGLKTSDDQIRRERFYESRYVQKKLGDLVQHIRTLKLDGKADGSVEACGDVEIDQAMFHELMNNHTVQILLGELDIIMDEHTCKFEMFDLEAIGQITLPHFVGTLLRLRGEPHKIDAVSSWFALRTLQKNFREFEQVVLPSLQALTVEQANIDQRLRDVSKFLDGGPRRTNEVVM